VGLFRTRRFQPTPDGWAIRLSAAERATLRNTVPQLRDLITETDPNDERIRRLFPTAYATDPEKEEEYRRYMRDELVQSKLAALDLFDASADATALTDGQLNGWMQSINGVRLVLGTMLDVQEDDLQIDEDDPNIDAYLLYDYLSGLLNEIVVAQSSAEGWE
jgi:Domain of unknown function (DUF2017)